MSATEQKKNHVKFGDEDESTSVKVAPVTEAPVKNSRYDDSDSESDDEAPEEEGMDNVKDELEKKQMEKDALIKEEQRLLKEKRRKQNTIFKEQQAEKKSKQQQEEVESEEEEEDQLEELPQEFLQNIDNDEETNTTTSQHINFNDLESQLDQNPALVEEFKQQIKKSKKKSLKNLRKTMAKKGPVTVQVLSSETASKVMAPKKEIEVMSTRDRWLKRKALKRK